MSTFANVVKKYNAYSLGGIGSTIKEIESLQFLWFDSPFFDSPDELADPTRKLVVVIVESRLVDNLFADHQLKQELFTRLLNLKYDMLREGRQTRFLKMKTYSGPVHQDGKTLLAIRELLKEIRDLGNQFEGVLLVGSFPEAMIVRTWLRPEAHAFDLKDDSGKVVGSFPNGTRAYHVGCGIHAYRSEIVLADLDGNWESIYQLNGTITSGIFVPESEGLVAGNMVSIISKKGNHVVNTTRYQDFFWIKDDSWRIETDGDDSVTLLMDAGQAKDTSSAGSQLNPELSASDRLLPNAIAHPDIVVSRINARNISVTPDRRLLDIHGKPKSAPITLGIQTNIFDWAYDAELERRLLLSYFDRNHAFRTGAFSNQGIEIAKIAFELGFHAVDSGLSGIAGTIQKTDNASLLDFVNWLKRPAVIRGIGAHTSGRSACLTLFRDDHNYQLIECAVGDRPWRWLERGDQVVPSFEGHYTVDLNLNRTIWESNILEGLVPGFFLHVGCDANTPDGADIKPFSDPGYGACQNAEGVLFYLNALAVVSRSKNFYDGPTGFGKGFGSSDVAHFGDGWEEIFRTEGYDVLLARNPTDRKRSSFWSVIGDYTLRKWYPPLSPCARQMSAARNQDGRMALLYIGVDGKLYQSTQITPNGAWASAIPLDGWAKQVAVARNADDRLESIYIGSDNKLYHIWQSTRNGMWSTSYVLDSGSCAKQVAAGRNADGRLEVFYIGSDDRIYHMWQESPNGAWSQSHALDIGSWTTQLSVATNADGRLEVFYIGSDHKVYHIWQTTPNGTWSQSHVLDNGSWASYVIAAKNADGRLEVFYIGSDSKIHHAWQTTLSGTWTQSHVIDNGCWAKELSIGMNADGRLEVIYIGSDSKLYHLWQTHPNGAWCQSYVLDDGSWAKHLTVEENADGRIEVMYVGSDDRIYHLWQKAPNGPWSESCLLDG